MHAQKLILGRPNTKQSDAVAEWRLHGPILSDDGLIPDGTVAITGDTITDVSAVRRPSGVKEIPDIEAAGLVVPGLVDVHNHAPWNVFPKWRPTRRLKGRFDWRAKTRCGIWVNPNYDPYYRATISPTYRALLDGAPPDRLARLVEYGQVRGLLGGTTTMVVDADLDPDDTQNPPLKGFVRDASDWTGRIWGVLDVTCLMPAEPTKAGEPPPPPNLLARITKDLAADGKLLAHVAEGSDDFSRGEFMTLADRKLLGRGTALIHALALMPDDWAVVAKAGAHVVWSPSSNFRLYGHSLDIGMLLGLGIPVALAPDWSITGSSSLRDEIAFVRSRYPWIDAKTLFRMVTSVPADYLGIATGRIAVGKKADVIVLSGYDASVPDPYAFALDSTLDRVDLVTVDGVALYGEPSPIESIAAFQPGPRPEAVEFDYHGVRLSRALRFFSERTGTFAEVCAQLADAMKQAVDAVKRQTHVDIDFQIAPLWEPGD